MSKQDKQEPNNQQPVIEDLAVNEGQTAEIIGGVLRGGTEMKWDCLTQKPFQG